jgi:hypothetical protein
MLVLTVLLLVLLVVTGTMLIIGRRLTNNLVVLTPQTVADRYDLSAVVTCGNHSYLPISIYGKPEEHTAEILGTLSAFEKAHPELEITHWHIEKQQFTPDTRALVFGIWVDHRPARQQ